MKSPLHSGMVLAVGAVIAGLTVSFLPSLSPFFDAADEAREKDFLSVQDQGGTGASHRAAISQNQPYSTCDKPAELVAYLGQRGNATYARRRDLNFYLTTTNVLATGDCSCSGKVMSTQTLAEFESRLMAEAGVSKVQDLVTRPLHDEARVMGRQVEEMCGGKV